MHSILPQQVAEFIFNGFKDYWAEFQKLTESAKVRFEQRDWHGAQKDSRNRLLSYKRNVSIAVEQLRNLMGEASKDKKVWKNAKVAYAKQVEGCTKYEIAETFYNSIARKVVGKIGLDTSFMFLFADYGKLETSGDVNGIYNTYKPEPDLKGMFRRILGEVDLNAPFEDMERDIGFILERVKRFLPDVF